MAYGYAETCGSFENAVAIEDILVICSFLGNSPASWVLIPDVSELLIGSIFIGSWILRPPAYEDGTDKKFRNVGY